MIPLVSAKNPGGMAKSARLAHRPEDSWHPGAQFPTGFRCLQVFDSRLVAVRHPRSDTPGKRAGISVWDPAAGKQKRPSAQMPDVSSSDQQTLIIFGIIGMITFRRHYVRLRFGWNHCCNSGDCVFGPRSLNQVRCPVCFANAIENSRLNLVSAYCSRWPMLNREAPVCCPRQTNNCVWQPLLLVAHL
jgi:hypothetical protein